MEPRRRFHPHTRKEWEGIRPTFTDLYQVQRKKLPEIVEVLGQQGFHARECHYKTYIKKWGLDKKNKQSDMIFAFQKLQERQGKDTAFLIRGQTRSRKNVEHYWKRSRLNPALFSPVPNTPDGVEYRTPSPSPRGNSGEVGPKNTVLNDDASPFAEDEHFSPSQYTNQDLIFAPRSTSLRLLTSPGPLRAQDQALHFAKVLFQSHVERTSPNPERPSWIKTKHLLDVFYGKAYGALAAMAYGLSHINIEAALLDTFEIIPQMSKYDCQDVTLRLLLIIATYARSARKLDSRIIKAAIYEIVNKIGKVYGGTHPVPLTLGAIIKSFEDIYTISEMVLVVAKDIVARGLGHDHYAMEDVLLGLSDVYRAAGELSAALKTAEELHRIQLRRHRRDKTEDNLLSLLLGKNRMAESYTRLGNFAEAELWIEDGLRLCSEVQRTGSRDLHRSHFLHHRSLTKIEVDKWSAASETCRKVIDLRMRWLGPGDYVVVASVHRMQLLMERQAEEARCLRAAEGEHQDEGRRYPWVAQQDEPCIDWPSEPNGDGEALLSFGVEYAQPSSYGDLQDLHPWTHQLERQPWTTAHVETWTQEQHHLERYGDGQIQGPPAKEGQSWMAWIDEDMVEWTG